MNEPAQGEAITPPPRWTLADLRAARLPAPVAVWATPSVAERVRTQLPLEGFALSIDDELPDRAGTLIAIGGGKLIDRAKLLRHGARPELYLVACASVWGSGAEVSPIAVADDRDLDRKAITMGPRVAPDVRLVWPELAASLSPQAVRRACGDVWAHAVEALLSPLAGDELVRDAGALIARMLDVPVSNDARWFDLGAEACLLQARCSVGLVHGIAHVLEGPLTRAHPERGALLGHAGLCATFLWPVLRLLQSVSSTFAERCAAGGLDAERVLAAARALHDPELYGLALPELELRWKHVLRDPCTRTSCALIRPAYIDYFLERGFA